MSKLDANQVIRDVHDKTTGTLKISGSLTGTANAGPTTLQSALDADTGNTSAGVDLLNYSRFYFSFVATGINAADGVIKLQGSADDSTYDDISGATYTLATNPNDQTAFNVSDAGYRYFRAVYTEGSNSAGTITSKYILKG